MRVLVTLAVAFVLAFAAAVTTFASGCGEQCGGIICDACPPPLSLTFVDDTTGAALSGVTIDHPSGRCEENAGATTCYVDEFGAGTFLFVAGATGYQGLNVEETVLADEDGGCCSCGYIPRTLEVRLLPQ